MNFNHHFTVNAPLEDVARFHEQSASMTRITPPPILVQMHESPDVLSEGDVQSFTLWAGPLPLKWTAHIDQSGPTGFIDRQLRGPFAKWIHRHIYVPGRRGTTVMDIVEAELHHDPFWRAAGCAMWLGLPLLFRYRAWKTKRILERGHPAQPRDPAFSDEDIR